MFAVQEAFPSTEGWQGLVQVGLEPGSGAKALKLSALIPWFQGPPLSVSLVPRLKLSTSPSRLSPKQFLTINIDITSALPLDWLFFYAQKRHLGSWHPRRNVRLLPRSFRYVWVLSAWDGGLHSGTCAEFDGVLRRSRTRRCVGSDGEDYNESYCVGSCLDISEDFDYPIKHIWKDGYNNRCEDYRALSFCNATGYGPKWQSWPKEVGLDTSTSRKVAAMLMQGSESSGPSASALIVILLIFMPCLACFCGAGRFLATKVTRCFSPTLWPIITSQGMQQHFFGFQKATIDKDEQGLALVGRLELGDDIEIVCSWSARALSVQVPWSAGAPLAISFTPWLMLENLSSSDYSVAPNQSTTVSLAFERQADLYGWVFFYAERSIGTWHPRRNVRFTQRMFRYYWAISAWDGGMHSGSCASGFVRRRNRTCAGSDGEVYDDSFCIGSCMDKDPVLYWDYPQKRVWKDGYNNHCEDYRVLDFCRPDGTTGSKWQSWWGTFNDWVTNGEDASSACCLCGGGTYAVALPHVEETCPTVNCPANSDGSNVLEGCRCRAGFQGQINRSDDYPYFAGACWPVACPEHSTGYVPYGCTCEDGYIGHITPSQGPSTSAETHNHSEELESLNNSSDPDTNLTLAEEDAISNATEEAGVLRQRQFAGIVELEKSSSFLFVIFVMLLLWVAAMCGAIVYFISKKTRTTTASRKGHARPPSKVTPLEESTSEAEEVAKVLRGWSEGDLLVRKEGEDTTE
eukprot:g6190.t1